MSASARNIVCAAIPPMALDTASSGAPLAAVVIEVTMPEMLVPAPSRTAPISASPRPVRSASTSAMAAILLPK